MHPSDLPPGYVESWRKIISVYPPVDTQTMGAALGTNGYPGSMPMSPTTREVRLNTEKGRIEIWERKTETDHAFAQRVGGFQGAAQSVDPPREPGKLYMQRTSDG